MISWGLIGEIISPRYWLAWLWTTRDSRHCVESEEETTYMITADRCHKCDRFLSWHSSNNGYCSYHNVQWSGAKEGRSSYQLFKNSFEMWLRSRCGGDLDEGMINTQLLTLSSYLDYAKIHTPAGQLRNSNLYDFCDEAFCDYQLVYDFLIDMRLQAKDKHPPKTEIKICEALHRFIEFRKFQLPIKGIIENRYSATERLIDNYKSMLLLNSDCDKLDLVSTPISQHDINRTVSHFLPQYDIIINYLSLCHQTRSMENGTDIEFSTSLLCAYLYSIMPEHADMLYLVRVRDLCLDSNTRAEIEYSSEKHLSVELSQYVSCRDLPSPVIASACINKLQKCLTLDPKTNAIVQAYITFIRPRITKSNDYLLLSACALGLTPQDVHERIITLVYRVTGKVTHLVDRFTEPESSTPRPPKSQPSLRFKTIPRQSKQALKKVRFNRAISKKLIKRYAKNKQKMRRKLVIDLSQISS